MQINEIPAPCDDGNRASNTVFVGAKNLSEDTGFRSTNQQYRDLRNLLAAAPDEELHPIICRHFPAISKQQILHEAADGRGGEI